MNSRRIRCNVGHVKNSFFQLELGLVRPDVFQKRFLNKRITDIVLDPSTSIERAHTGAVNTIDIEEAEARYLISGGGDGSIHVYDLDESEREERRIIKSIASVNRSDDGHRGGVSRVRWYPFDNGMFTTSSFDSTIKVWDTNAMEVACTFDLANKVYSHAMSSKATHGLIANLHNSASPPLAESNSAHTRAVNGVSFTPDGLYLVTTGHDDKMRLWNLYTGQNTLTNYGTMIRNQFVHNLSPLISPLSVAPPSSYYVFHPSDDRSILMFDLMDGSLVKRLTGSYGRVTALAWRPRTQEIYSAGNDHDILVWSPKNIDRNNALQALADQDTWSDSDSD
ncbi:DNA excision repair protein ERCC-8 [Lobosporangium transversale]|nr:DNA excision repair protein ERCC-8 [Lobosporangium transversale]